MNFSVIVGTYGDRSVWGPLADQAIESVKSQSVQTEFIKVHAGTLAQARNEGARLASNEWLVFLDADDELDPRYIESMTAALDGQRRLLQPATLGVTDGREDDYPVVIPSKPLRQGNHLIIGTGVQRSVFFDAGGFFEWPGWEDWCLWLRCNRLGATVKVVPDAVYRVHVKESSRNNSITNPGDLFRKILNKHDSWAKVHGL